MKHYILYSHDGSGNHGCEALVRTTVMLFGKKENKFTLSSTHPDEDKKYGIDQLCDIKKMHETTKVSKFDLKFLKCYFILKFKGDYRPLDDLCERRAFNARKGDVALSIGGDSYCYGMTKEMALRNEIWKNGGLKTVYWGCSIEPELLEDANIAADIAKFDLITARESISYEALKKVNPNTVLVSDSAFLLNAVMKPMPIGFENTDLVGLNLSPMAEGCEKIQGITRKNYENLIEYILKETKMKILLVPHVIWKGTDDRTINKYFYDKYMDTGRIAMLSDCNCEELKGYISRCRFFIGARTHATIAAYSTLVPTLVLGYSVKSRGIARDLFGSEENYVLPVQNLRTENDLTEAFKWIYKHEEDIKKQLKWVMPEYKNRVMKAVELVKAL